MKGSIAHEHIIDLPVAETIDAGRSRRTQRNGAGVGVGADGAHDINTGVRYRLIDPTRIIKAIV